MTNHCRKIFAQAIVMEQNDIQESAKVLSIDMLNNPHHIGVFLGNGENERREIEKMFFELFNNLPGVVFIAKENDRIIGVIMPSPIDGLIRKIEKAYIINLDIL